jgi:hypothetical protein
MDAEQRQQFVRSYTKVLATAWTDEGFIGRLRSDPKAVLGEFGLDTPAGATVDIRTDSEGEPNLDQAVTIWEEGASSHVYRLYVPPEPPGTLRGGLTENQLENMSGGSVADSCCCCCSSPCCCCT